ncbi:MAG: hypothetical protein ACXVCK_14015, partial [Bdellovibrionota bacterium]
MKTPALLLILVSSTAYADSKESQILAVYDKYEAASDVLGDISQKWPNLIYGDLEESGAKCLPNWQEKYLPKVKKQAVDMISAATRVTDVTKNDLGWSRGQTPFVGPLADEHMGVKFMCSKGFDDLIDQYSYMLEHHTANEKTAEAERKNLADSLAEHDALFSKKSFAKDFAGGTCILKHKITNGASMLRGTLSITAGLIDDVLPQLKENVAEAAKNLQDAKNRKAEVCGARKAKAANDSEPEAEEGA